MGEITLLASLPQPPTVRDFMVFEQHVEGVAKLTDPQATIPPRWSEAPACYFTNPYAITGPDEAVPVAPGSTAFDLELAVAAVIGRPGTNLPPEQAEAHIAGHTILIDDTATTLAPALVTPDELASVRRGKSFNLAMTASVNDTLTGQDSLASMACPFAEMAAYASRGTWVKPGDIFGSGTCGGCLAELWAATAAMLTLLGVQQRNGGRSASAWAMDFCQARTS